MLKSLLTAALLGAQTMPAEPVRCVTRQQISDMVVFLAPYMIDGLRSKCGAHLGATAFLMSAGATEMAARARRAGEGRIDSAIDGFMIFGSARRPPPRNVSRAMLLAGMSAGLADEVLGAMDPVACRDANDIVEAASQMSPDQFGRFIGGILSLSSRQRPAGDPPICRE